jgi:hypothetical protein
MSILSKTEQGVVGRMSPYSPCPFSEGSSGTTLSKGGDPLRGESYSWCSSSVD